MSEIRDRRDLGAFIPSSLDDYPLNAYEFRLYAHIVRRVGKSNCFESIPNMAAHCRMNERTAVKALKLLIDANLISCEKRPGKTNLYALEPESDWISPGLLDKCRCTTTCKNAGTTTCKNAGTTTCKNAGTTTCKNAGTPPAKMQDEGSTSKGIPIKDPLSPTSLSQPEPERERNSKVEEKPKTEEATKGKNELADLVAQMPEQEREPFLNYARGKAAALPNTPVLIDSWCAAKFTELHKQFLASPDGKKAKEQADAEQYDFANLPNLPEVLKAAFHGGGVWVQEIEAEREWRMAFLRWARKSGAFETLEATL